MESAIIFEKGLTDYFDKTITVSCKKHIRFDRALKRAGKDDVETRKIIVHRMSLQMSDEKKEELADHVIRNDYGDMNADVRAIINNYTPLSPDLTRSNIMDS